MRATMAGGMTRVAAVANSLMVEVTAARPAIRVNDSRLWSQNSVLPPKPRSLIMESAKSKPYFSARVHHLAVEVEAGLVLRRVLRDQPAVVADGNEDADLHGGLRSECARKPGCLRIRPRHANPAPKTTGAERRVHPSRFLIGTTTPAVSWPSGSPCGWSCRPRTSATLRASCSRWNGLAISCTPSSSRPPCTIEFSV